MTLFINYSVANSSNSSSTGSSSSISSSSVGDDDGDVNVQTLSIQENALINFKEILANASIALSGFESKFTASIYDPALSMKLISTTTLELPSTFQDSNDALNNSTAIAFNGKKIILQQKKYARVLKNRADVPITLGRDLNTYFCARKLGEQAIPGSDGQCGPNGGPQCADCKGLSVNSIGTLTQNFDADYYKLCAKTGRLLSQSSSFYSKKDGFPCNLCYDVRNNFLWGWDYTRLTAKRWRNSGLPPRSKSKILLPVSSSEPPSSKTLSLKFLEDEICTNLDPNTRVELLMDSTDSDLDATAVISSSAAAIKPSRQAALIYALVDRIADPYGPSSADQSAAEADAKESILVSSKGKLKRHLGSSLISVKGKILCQWNEDNTSSGGKGYNIIVLSKTLELIKSCSFAIGSGIYIYK